MMIESMLTYDPATMTYAKRDATLRAALAGVPVTTPLDLVVLMGGKADAVTAKQLELAAWDLRYFGYELEVIQEYAYGPPAERYVRRRHWPEDDQWPA